MVNFLLNSIAGRIALWSSGIVLLVLTAFTAYVGRDVARMSEADHEAGLAMVVQQAIAGLDSFHKALAASTENLAQVFENEFVSGLALDPNKTTTVGGIETAVLNRGSVQLNLNFAEVDRFTRLTRSVATVFVRHGDDFVRVTTSLKKEDGTRAVGTKLGPQHPAYASLQQRVSYLGKAKLFGRDYMTKYTPVTDNTGRVIAVLFVGFDYTEQLRQMLQKMAEIKVGQLGHIWIVDKNSGNGQLRLLMHPQHRDKDVSAGSEFASFKQAAEQGRGTLHYLESGSQAQRVASYDTFPTWNWVVAASADLAELDAGSVALRNRLFVASGLAVVVIALAFALLLRDRLMPLRNLASLSADLAGGDLTARVNYAGHDEIGTVAGAFNAMATQIRGLIAEVKQGADGVTRYAGELSSAARQVSAGTTEQNIAAVAVAASVQRLTSAIGEVAEGARSAEALTCSSADQSERGGQVIEQVAHDMNRIADSVVETSKAVAQLGQESGRIQTIVKVIKDIADQTSLLALNAAIEAARAGEQGRGFAVVADEVRKLAERTAQSTQEIGAMIVSIQTGTRDAVASMDQGVRNVNAGVELATHAGTAIQDMRGGVAAVATAVRDIADHIRSQQSASQEIAKSVERIATMVEQNSAAMTQTAGAASHLSTLAVDLRASVERFRT